MIGEKLAEKAKIIEKIVEEACRLDGRGRTGGCLAVYDVVEKKIHVIQVGVVPNAEDAARYRKFCAEKVQRLIDNPIDDSSWLTRNPGANKYGGGVSCFCCKFGFSGLSEHGDELVSAAVAMTMYPDLMSRLYLELIAKISSNPHLVEFCMRGWSDPT